MPNVLVHLALHRPCDPVSHDIKTGETSEAARFDAHTDAQGIATFPNVPVGCYYFGMTPPEGSSPVPVGMHTLFLTTAGATQKGTLEFNNMTSSPNCDETTIETSLGVDPAPAITIDLCDGAWAVVRWDSRGDNQQIINSNVGGWQTYTIFPHTICWAKATADGVPDRFKRFFDC
ncbi:hypothetical protein ACFWU5_00695 [Nocardia sp. NPDC058640]|uniref:hypothetical protein n=1 Tax=Nocardia sp. NPDC058640 TaxID=3346571 RepID=UPI00365827BD